MYVGFQHNLGPLDQFMNSEFIRCFRLDDSYSLDSQIESLRDVHEKHQLEKSMKMPRHIGYGEKSRSRDSSFYGAGSKNHEYHPWPLIEGIELKMWCAFDLVCFSAVFIRDWQRIKFFRNDFIFPASCSET